MVFTGDRAKYEVDKHWVTSRNGNKKTDKKKRRIHENVELSSTLRRPFTRCDATIKGIN